MLCQGFLQQSDLSYCIVITVQEVAFYKFILSILSNYNNCSDYPLVPDKSNERKSNEKYCVIITCNFNKILQLCLRVGLKLKQNTSCFRIWNG